MAHSRVGFYSIHTFHIILTNRGYTSHIHISSMILVNTNIKMLERLIRILGVLKDPRAVETLESFSQHSNKRIRNAIDRTLFQIRGY